MQTDKEKTYSKALKIASQLLADLGTCTHYPGYTCDKGFPEACPACIKRWLLRKVKQGERVNKDGNKEKTDMHGL